jgi:hypothetical protein
MHPAFSFLNADQLNPADGALTLQFKAKKILSDMKGKPTQFFNTLNFGTRDAGFLSNPLLGHQNFSLNDLTASLKIPAADPIKEFTDRMDHERFYLRLIFTFVNTLTTFLRRLVSPANTFWVGILWSTMLLAKKAETYSANLLTNLQNRANCFNIQGFDQHVRNSNGYELELATIENFMKTAKQVLRSILELNTQMKQQFDSLAKNRPAVNSSNIENISFCMKPQSPETVQQKLTENIQMTFQVYFSQRRDMGLENDLSTMKKIALLDIFMLNEIEAQVQLGANGFSRELFYSAIESEYEVKAKIHEMETVRFKDYV